MTASFPAPPPPGAQAPPPAGSATALRPGGPDLRKVFVAEYRLLLRSVATRGRLLAVSALAALSVLTAVIVRSSGDVDSLQAGVDFVNGNIATLFPVAVLVFGAATIGDLIDDGSLVYLWLRPVPARIHVLAAWAATVTITVPLILVPVVVATTVIDSDPGLLSGAIIGGLVAIVGYAALFVVAGIRFRRALAWGLVYILIWEGFVASAGETATKLAMRSYVRSILADRSGVSLKLGEFSLGVGIVVPLVVGALVLAYGARRLARTDVA
ncbi:ABC transporter permease [soil metagenome]